MKKILMTAIKTSIFEVMETMFFMPVELGQESPFSQIKMDQESLDFACQLTFKGDASGYVTIMAPKNLVVEMAENFLGESRECLTQDLMAGTLAEMVNMVCGNALSKTNSKVPFELGIPETVNASEIADNEIVTMVETTKSKMAFFLKVD